MKLVAMTLPYARESMERALTGIAKAGYRYVGFGLNHAGTPVPSKDATDAELDALAELFDRHGLIPYVMFAGADPAAPGGIESYCRRLDIAKRLSVPYVIGAGTWGYRTFPDVPYTEEELAEAHAKFVQGIKRVAAHAERIGVRIALKPHTGNTATAAILLKTIADIGSPVVEPFYDPGNVQFYEGIDAATDMELIMGNMPLICAKDHRGPRANRDFPLPGEGDVDYKRIFAHLRKMNFDGAVTVERVDGADTGPIPADELDARMQRARQNLIELARGAGFPDPV